MSENNFPVYIIYLFIVYYEHEKMLGYHRNYLLNWKAWDSPMGKRE